MRNLSRRGLLAGFSAATTALVLPGGPATAAAAPDAGWRTRLRELERAYDGRVGAYALDTGTGLSVGYRATERFPLLSTFKALAAAAVLRHARHRDPGLMERVLHWTEDDLLPNSPETSLHVADGLTVAQVCRAAVVHSDNTAGNLMLSLLGGPAGLTGFARRLGDPVTRLDRWETDLNDWAPGERRDTTAPAAIGRDLYALTVGNALHPEDRATLVDWLRGAVTGGSRIRAGLPADWITGDKTGSSSSYGGANDIAVTWPPSAPPLILAVYTHRNTVDAGYDNAVVASTATILVEALRRR